VKIYEKTKMPTDEQIAADKAATEAFLAKRPVTKLPPAWADNCVTVLPAQTRQSHKQRGARS
jgi:hypothetical protein